MINTSDFIADLVQAAPTNHLVDNIGIAQRLSLPQAAGRSDVVDLLAGESPNGEVVGLPLTSAMWLIAPMRAVNRCEWTSAPASRRSSLLWWARSSFG
jgi:hypothetical protein